MVQAVMRSDGERQMKVHWLARPAAHLLLCGLVPNSTGPGTPGIVLYGAHFLVEEPCHSLQASQTPLSQLLRHLCV